MDDIQIAEATVAFYETRLEQALERLGELVAQKEARAAALRAYSTGDAASLRRFGKSKSHKMVR